MQRERWGVDQNSELLVIRDLSHQPRNPILRFLAGLISYVFHPLFVPVYIAWFLITFQPQLFASFSPRDKVIVVVRFFVIYTMFPLVTVLLAKGLGFLKSIHLNTQKERIIPYMACGIYYFWMSYVLRHQSEFAPEVVQLAMAIFIASSIGLIVNIYMKVSLHAISMGVMVVFTGMIARQVPDFSLYMSIVLLIAGLVCTARLIVSDHSPQEIYAGLLTGAASMMLAVWADGILP